jgi:hypothetical protein
MKPTNIFNCSVFELKKVHNRAGNLTFLEEQGLPFPIKRIYYLYDVPGGASRGGHAHRHLYQLIVAASGSFDVLLNDGRNKKIIQLNRPYFGLLVVPGIWREIFNFSSGAICLVLASHKYDQADYIRDYEVFNSFIHDS